jgi:hypothetical protein
MAKEPKTTGEHIIALYGHITGLKREVSSIKNNHLKHMHQDIDKIHGKVDRLLYWLLGGLVLALIFIISIVTVVSIILD